MTKRDFQATEYRAESYAKHLGNRVVPDTDSCCQPFDSAHFTSQEPAAWAVWHRSEDAPGRVAYASAIQSIRGTGEMRDGEEFIPLYGKPTLTDAEREAIYRAEARLRTAYVPDDETAATLRKLLERLK